MSRRCLEGIIYIFSGMAISYELFYQKQMEIPLLIGGQQLENLSLD